MLETHDKVESVYLDFAKAFDKVDHHILLNKLAVLGITGKLHNWITIFLKNRKQVVIVNGISSSSAWVTSGVPQGSVIGPLLFLIMMQDITQNVMSSKLSSFADDTRLWYPADTNIMYTAFQQDLDIIYNWAKANNMEFNSSKFESITFGPQAQATNNKNNTLVNSVGTKI